MLKASDVIISALHLHFLRSLVPAHAEVNPAGSYSEGMSHAVYGHVLLLTNQTSVHHVSQSRTKHAHHGQ